MVEQVLSLDLDICIVVAFLYVCGDPFVEKVLLEEDKEGVDVSGGAHGAEACADDAEKKEPGGVSMGWWTEYQDGGR